MSEVTTEMTWGGLNAVELGALIAGIAVAVVLVIVFVTVCFIIKSGSKEKESRRKNDDEKMVSMQTSRIVGGQPMQQVIMKSQPNGNMDKHNSTSENLQTIDLETNTVRYDMANSSTRRDSQPTVSDVDETHKVVDLTRGALDSDSGTGDSPIRATVVVHSDGEDKDSQPSKRSSDSGANARGADNAAYSSDEEEIPFTTSVPYYPIPPPPPESDPPPPTPGVGIPVTDLDEGETIIVPPLPPPPDQAIYAEINKNRSGSSNENSIKRSYRDVTEIQIIEKEKF